MMRCWRQTRDESAQFSRDWHAAAIFTASSGLYRVRRKASECNRLNLGAGFQPLAAKSYTTISYQPTLAR